MDRSPFIQQVRNALRSKHYAFATEKSYCYWVRNFIRFNNYQSVTAISAEDVTDFLTHLAVNRNVSPSTQDQAFNALIFLFRHVLELPIENIKAVRSKKLQQIPVVLSTREVRAILDHLEEPFKTMIRLAWGGGLRQSEILRLRIKDIDFERKTLTIKEGKGRKDRATLLPDSCIDGLRQCTEKSRLFHKIDVSEGYGEVYMPFALAKKFPNQANSLHWQFVFSAPSRSIDPMDQKMKRHHIHSTTLARNLRIAVKKAGILKKVTCHTFRHTFATQLLESGYDIRTVQELLGHDDVKTTQIYTHVLQRGANAVISPADRL